MFLCLDCSCADLVPELDSYLFWKTYTVIWKTLDYSCPERCSLRAVCDDSTDARLLLCYLPVLPYGLQNEISCFIFC